MPRVAAAARRGFTLIELVVAVVLVGFIGMTIINVLVRQQRFYGAASAVMQTRSQVRQAAGILPNDLRGISPAAGDLLAHSDSSIEFYATTGTGVVCESGPRVNNVQQLYLLPSDARRGPFTSFAVRPEPADEVSVFDDTAGTFSPRKRLLPVAGGTAVAVADPAACAVSPFLDAAADAGKPRYRVSVDLASGAPASRTVVVGAPVRFLRRVRYSLYASPTDGQWYLGYSEATAGGMSAVEPVSGPYRPYAPDATSGLAFSYYNAAGQLLAPGAPAAAVARIGVAVRALTRTQNASVGLGRQVDGRYADENQFSVALRNRW